MQFSFSMSGQWTLLHSKIETSKLLPFNIWHFSAAKRKFPSLCYTFWTVTEELHVHVFHFWYSPVYFTLLCSTLLQEAWSLLGSVGGHPDLVSLLSDWQTDKSSCVGPVGCRWTQIAGPWWMAAGRGLTATGGRDLADSSALQLSVKHFGGHCRSLDLYKQASLSAGEVSSNKSADGCGCCLEVINRNEVWLCVHSKTQAKDPSISWKDKDSCQGAVCTLLAMSLQPSHMRTNKKPLWSNLASRLVNQVSG